MVYNDKLSSYEILLSRNKSLDIYKTCMKALCVEMYRIRNFQVPTYMQSLFIPCSGNYELRDNNTFVLPKFDSKTYGYHSMSYIGAKVWGNISLKVKESKNIREFKTEINTWLSKQHNSENFMNAYF